MKRRRFTSKFKAKVALAAIKEEKTLPELAKQFDLHPQQIRNWKREFLAGADIVFEKKGGKGDKSDEALEERESRLLRTIGELKVENDFLKKSLK